MNAITNLETRISAAKSARDMVRIASERGLTRAVLARIHARMAAEKAAPGLAADECLTPEQAAILNLLDRVQALEMRLGMQS